jgi:hypothetical protein
MEVIERIKVLYVDDKEATKNIVLLEILAHMRI